MPKVLEQLTALTQIRALVAQHFPYLLDNFAWDDPYISCINLEHAQEIECDDERKVYVLKVLPECKVCHDLYGTLIEIPTQTRKFYLCKECYSNVRSVETCYECDQPLPTH